jgi:mannose/fructose/N-acetylgalactosamine-specific phosphotransferase system component IIC
MGSIHGAVFLVVGFTVSIVSHFLMKSGKNFIIFLWFGICMAFFGVVKLVFAFIRSQTNISKNNNQINQKHNNTYSSKDMQHNQTVSNHNLSHAKYCPQCGLKMHINYRFCPKCGTQV